MPHFVFIATDAPGTAQARQTARPAHVSRLKELESQGRLVVAGPCPQEDNPEVMSGSVIVAEFDSLADAKAWASLDPYVEAGVYTHVEIKPFIKALP